MARLKKYIDIGANLIDEMYQGIYNTKNYHKNDLVHVLDRTWVSGLDKVIITGTSLKDSQQSLEIANTDTRLYCTVGCHPTKCSEFLASDTTPNDYLEGLKQIVQTAQKGKVVAIGECGLDYNRLNFCPKDVQKQYFEQQLSLATHFDLPLFLHCRNAASDVLRILDGFGETGVRGVVHSFDGSFEEAEMFLNRGFYIGINGCSLKTEDNLKTIEKLPVNRILLETDSPWCSIRPTHAGYKYVADENRSIFESVKKEKWKEECMVKGRNEPCNIRMVLDVIAGVVHEDPIVLSEIIYKNTVELFFNQK